MQMISLRCHISVFPLALLFLCRGACGLDLVMKMGLRWRVVYGPPQPDGLGAFCHATSMKNPPSKKELNPRGRACFLEHIHARP